MEKSWRNVRNPHEGEAGKMDNTIMYSEWGEKTVVLGLKRHDAAVSTLFAL